MPPDDARNFHSRSRTQDTEGDEGKKEEEQPGESEGQKVDAAASPDAPKSRGGRLWKRLRAWKKVLKAFNHAHSETESAPPKQDDKHADAVEQTHSLDSLHVRSFNSRSSASTDDSVHSKEGGTRLLHRRSLSSFFAGSFMRRRKAYEQLLPNSNTDVERDYEMRGVVGRGQFGVVCACTERSTGKIYACKTLLKENLYLQESKETVRNEVEIQQVVQHHPNIVNLRGVYEDSKTVNLIMDYCSGGTLTDFIVEHGNYSERAAALLLRDIVKVVDHCHKHGVVHRDIKLSNFLLADESDTPTLMAIDFGVSCFYKPGTPLTKTEGSPFYMAPEVLEESYGPECDIWSCGVCLYILLSGEPPFNGGTVLNSFKLVREAKLDFNKEPWMHISEGAKDLISLMLRKDPSERPTPEQILAHPWMQDDPTCCAVPLGSIVLPRLRQFCALSKFQQMARMAIAESLSDAELKNLKYMFRAVDRNGNGLITLDELQNALSKIGSFNKEAISSIMESVDVDGSGTIDYTEFVGATLKLSRSKREQRLSSVFKELDTNGDGYLSRDEIEALCTRYRVGDLEAIIAMLDQYKDNKPQDCLINYSEFMETMSGHDSRARLLVL